MAADKTETKVINKQAESFLDTEVVLAAVDESYEAVKECLDAAEQALNIGNKAEYKKKVGEAKFAWGMLTMELYQRLPSGSTVREEVLNYCGDLNLVVDEEIELMTDRVRQMPSVQSPPPETRGPINLETARKNYAETKIKAENLRGVKELLTLGPSREQVIRELTSAENDYRNAYAEYVGASVINFLDEKNKFAKAELDSFAP